MTPQELRLCVRRAGYQQTTAWRGRFRRIFDHQLFFCRGGTAAFSTHSTRFALRPGELIIIPPDTPYSLELPSGEPAQLSWCHFDLVEREDQNDLDAFLLENQPFYFDRPLPRPEFIRSNPDLEGLGRPPFTMALERSGTVEELMHRLVNEYFHQHRLWRVETRITLTRLFLEMYRQNDAIHSAGRKRPGHDRIVRSIEKYVDQNIESTITLKSLAGFLGYHEDYLGRIFRAHTGSSFHHWLQATRVEKAGNLIRGTDMTLDEIAEHTGFCDAFYLSRVFRKVAGVRPREWREEHSD